MILRTQHIPFTCTLGLIEWRESNVCEGVCKTKHSPPAARLPLQNQDFPAWILPLALDCNIVILGCGNEDLGRNKEFVHKAALQDARRENPQNTTARLSGPKLFTRIEQSPHFISWGKHFLRAHTWRSAEIWNTINTHDKQKSSSRAMVGWEAPCLMA